jgi:prophage DNA circulation protein
LVRDLQEITADANLMAHLWIPTVPHLKEYSSWLKKLQDTVKVMQTAINDFYASVKTVYLEMVRIRHRDFDVV